MINNIILASKSRVRKEILNENGIDCEVYLPMLMKIKLKNL